MTGKGRGRGRSRQGEDEEAGGRPSAPSTLFDFLESKMGTFSIDGKIILTNIIRFHFSDFKCTPQIQENKNI